MIEELSSVPKVAFVTNMPAPYRLPIFEKLAAEKEFEFLVLFCAKSEPDRKWDIKCKAFNHLYLRERFFTYRGRYIHFNVDIWSKLKGFKPDIVITTGFNPTFIIAYIYCRLARVRHIPMTDGTYDSERTLSFVHRAVRKIIYRGSAAFLAASNGAFKLYESYGIQTKSIFRSQLCADNDLFFAVAHSDKKYDFIFSGRFVAVKNPLFAIEVAREVSRRLGRTISMLFIGSGEMETHMRAVVSDASGEVDAVFWGFAKQENLPELYSSARVFLFPTLWDPWGVVANEACAAGLPVIVTPHAGSANELIRNNENGYVLPLEVDKWAAAAVALLTDSDLYKSMSDNTRLRVSEYNFRNAAQGVSEAIKRTLLFRKN